MKTIDIEGRAGSLLEEVLRKVPTVTDVNIAAERRLGEATVDLFADVSVSAGSGEPTRHVLIVEAKASGQPKWARAAADVLDRHLRQATASGVARPYGVFVAPYISDLASKTLIERGFGYLDFAGNGRLEFNGVYIERKGNPNPFSERSELRTLFSPKASRVLRVLLMHPHKPWRMAALAEQAGVSIGLAAKVKPLLLDREWAIESPGGLILIHPGSALDAWEAGFRRRKAQVHDYFGFGSAREVEERLAVAAERAGAPYGLAEFSGAERLAPHVRYTRSAAYVDADALKEVARMAELRPIESGPNIRLFEPFDDGVFFGCSDIGGVRVVHPIQLYLDLKKVRGRGEEGADFLRQHIIEPAWEASRRETDEAAVE